jgi:hypothetical protein
MMVCLILSVDANIDRIKPAVTEAMDMAIPFGWIRKNKYPSWFSGKLKFCIKRVYIYNSSEVFKICPSSLETVF